MSRLRWLILSGVLLAIVGCYGRSHNRLILLQHRLWQVSSQGRITAFPYSFPSAYDDELAGSTLPLPSPDGRWIAFGQFAGDYDLRLLDVRSGRERRITRLGQPSRNGYVWVSVLLDGWSPDSRQLLFAVAPGEDTSESGDLAVPQPCHRFYIYDLATERAHAVELPRDFQFAAWLPDGRFLGVIPAQRPQEDERLVMLPPGDTQGLTVTTKEGTPHQVRVSADRKWLIGLVVGPGEQRATARIVKISVSAMSVVPLASLSSWTGNERPALSPPDGEHFSYKRETRMVRGIPEETLFVDGRLLYSCHGPIDYEWVDERSIAVACQDQVLVLDSTSGKTMGRYSLVPVSADR